MIKKWWMSKTFWLGVLMIVAAAIEYIAGLPAGTSAIQAVSGVLTIIIRFLTNTAIAGTLVANQPTVGTPGAEKK